LGQGLSYHVEVADLVPVTSSSCDDESVVDLEIGSSCKAVKSPQLPKSYDDAPSAEPSRDALACCSKLDDEMPLQEGFAHVARSVPRSEVRQVAAADKACKAEWDRLISVGCWDPESVREWVDVKRDANRRKEDIHIGSLHELCMEKGSELPQGDPGRKYKGRVVFLGDRVKDQFGRVAVFEEMSSSPAALEAGKFCDYYGLLSSGGTSSATEGGSPQRVIPNPPRTSEQIKALVGLIVSLIPNGLCCSRVTPLKRTARPTWGAIRLGSDCLRVVGPKIGKA